MSTPGRTCRDIKAYVATLETKESRNSITTKYPMSRQEIKEQYRKNTVTDQLMLRHYMKKFCHDKVMNVVTLKDKISGPDRETKSRQEMLT